MEPARSILVLRARHAPFDVMPYVVHLLAEEWRRRGMSVEVADSLPKPAGPEVLVFPHFDLTVIPPRIAERLSRSAHVLNRRVMDISKRVISRQLIRSPEEYDGPVIVKTDLNFGGWPELRVLKYGDKDAYHQVQSAQKGLPWPVSGMLHGKNYPIYDNPRLVPPAVWDNPLLVVEKFLPEREGDLYCLRQYVFLGSCEINTRAVSADPLVKSSGVIRREVLDATPPAVRAFREELGFDYGKFDYVVHDGEPIVFDVNRTFTYNRDNVSSTTSLITKLADGIEPFLGRG